MCFSLSFSVGTMNAFRKAIFFLSVAAVLLCVPLTAAAEDDDVQSFPTVNSAISPAAASPSARRTVLARGAVVSVPSPAPLRYASEPVTNFVLHDGRSHLRSFCLLRC